MNIYLKQQFLIHASHAAKEHMKHKGHTLKKNMPANLTKKNALKVARYRSKKKTFVKELRELATQRQQENAELNEQVVELRHELDYYHKQYGIERTKPFHTAKKKQLQNITSLQRQLIDQQLEARDLHKAKKISDEEYEELLSRLDIHQKALRKKKQKLLLE